ncbi:metal-sensing transcriptional repressor [Thermosipho ferrireducens]|uniref:Copper-sensing transcriptional repressor CsoR n=1 Tax=Thermosipho ferrireducens TaxID=2571116 RepID=A0ABX7S7G5_9BACT|nr:metal-sensing transcriptional repressor [Thermosipho ferrireducens]QTA37216.1 metal-sensing transcriptional repressor [Thermosipho ferrireducens]
MKKQKHLHKHEKAVRDLKTAKGQIDAIIRMIEDDRYCIDISTQILAVISLLKKANTKVLKTHIETCIKEAINASEEKTVESKLEELEKTIEYMEKHM